MSDLNLNPAENYRGGDISHSIKKVGSLDLIGGGQVIVQGDYAYVGHMKPSDGTTIINVADPRKPKVIWQGKLSDEKSHTHKVRVSGDIMVTNVEQNNRHVLRAGSRIPEMRLMLEAEGGDASDANVAAALGVKVEMLDQMIEAQAEGFYTDGGFKTWDISDRSNPKELSHVKTHGFGTHRFDMDESYAYISTEMVGYIGNILVIYDLTDPTKPEEVSRWHMPGQHLAGGEIPNWTRYSHRLHHALRVGNEMWASVWQAGFRVIDVTDITKPITVAEHNYHPMVREPTHTILPVPQLINGRRIAVVIDEEHAREPGNGQAPANLWTFDVTDFDNIHGLGSFHVSEMDCPWSRTSGARFGAHQFQDHLENSIVCCTWFAGGLRVVDVANPARPKEVGCFMPEPRAGYNAPQSNDVDVDDRGLMYLLDRDKGFDILELTG
ncbi:MAG: LVIVD repeat-containing protein [Rhodospirillales bacterium]|jgi:hypothetical protein